jgi:L-arabinose isomerase
MKMSDEPRGRIGVFGIGLAAYWPQFPGLEPRIRGSLDTIVRQIGTMATVFDGGVVDTAQAGAQLGDRFAREDLDLVFLFTGTYATSTQALPVVQRAGCPVVVLNLQPVAAMNYTTADTLEMLATASVCPVPELMGVFLRSGIAAHLVTGTVDNDTVAWNEIDAWCRAAHTARTIRHARFGMLGHTYPGMIDMSTDVGVVHGQLGVHVELLELNDLQTRLEEASGEVVEAMVARSQEAFVAAGDISPEAWVAGARVAVGLEGLVEDFALDGLAYYYRGAAGSPIEHTASNMILGNTLLTGAGVPAAGEGDLKTAIAMKIVHEMGDGGSFCEFAAMDLAEDFFLFGHDGPAHTGLSDEPVSIRELKVFHGKSGGGLSVEMRPAIGPVTALGLTIGLDGRLKLIAAEGETIPGPVPAIGNSLSRVRFGQPVREFLTAWCALAPTHHVALGRGHRIADYRKVALLLNVAFESV